MPQIVGNKVKFPIYIRKELFDRLESYKGRNELERNVIIKCAISEYLDRVEREEKKILSEVGTVIGQTDTEKTENSVR